MRRHLLDTGPLAAYLKGRPPAVQLLSPWIARREAATSALVYAENLEYFKRLLRFDEQRPASEGMFFATCGHHTFLFQHPHHPRE